MSSAGVGKIKNFDELAVTEARKAALQIAEAGLLAIDTGAIIRNFIKIEGKRLIFGGGLAVEPLALGRRIFFVGVGKCAYNAAVEVEKILEENLCGGIVLDVNFPKENALRRIRSFEGTHPMPSESNISASREIVSLLTDMTSEDLVIMVISGGGSTLLCLPSQQQTCVEEKLVVESLFKAGATIQEINTVRKHLSVARGGFLAWHAHPARVISLIFSDVPGNELGFIASGPTVKDETTVADALAIVERYKIGDSFDTKTALIETPKDDFIFENVLNTVVASNEIALKAMEKTARELGFQTTVVTSTLAGEVAEVSAKLVKELRAARERSVLLYGGETTVKIKGGGRGGRNQELALRALGEIEPNELILSFASDGRDNGDYMGALADETLKNDAERRSLQPKEFLDKNNSSEFFEQAGGLLKSGYTGSNVSDLIISIKN